MIYLITPSSKIYSRQMLTLIYLLRQGLIQQYLQTEKSPSVIMITRIVIPR